MMKDYAVLLIWALESGDRKMWEYIGHEELMLEVLKLQDGRLLSVKYYVSVIVWS